jgi:hypothetical protein
MILTRQNVVEVVTFVMCIREVPNSNFGGASFTLTAVFIVFLSPL